MKPFKILTAEDCIDGKLYFPEVKSKMSKKQLEFYEHNGPSWIKGLWISMEDANKLITEKGQVGYNDGTTNMLKDFTITHQKYPASRNKILFFIHQDPVEEEKVECEHCTNGQVGFMGRRIDFNYCPKCGTKLK